MNVRTETLDLAMVVVPEGRLDFAAAGGFESHVEQVISAAANSRLGVIVDCGALDYVSSAGLRVFLLGARESQRRAVSFALCALKPAVREVFELSGFTRIIPVHPDRTAALAQVPRRSV